MTDLQAVDAVPLISSPVFPCSVKWSSENLAAVAAGHLVTIFSPASLHGPRAFVACKQSPPFELGSVGPDELKQTSLLASRLDRDARVAVRCIDWSPEGSASHGGCLLGVCTTDGHVKLYRAPYFELCAEWIEVADVSELIWAHHEATGYRDVEELVHNYRKDDEAPRPCADWGHRESKKPKIERQGFAKPRGRPPKSVTQDIRPTQPSPPARLAPQPMQALPPLQGSLQPIQVSSPVQATSQPLQEKSARQHAPRVKPPLQSSGLPQNWPSDTWQPSKAEPALEGAQSLSRAPSSRQKTPRPSKAKPPPLRPPHRANPTLQHTHHAEQVDPPPGGALEAQAKPGPTPSMATDRMEMRLLESDAGSGRSGKGTRESVFGNSPRTEGQALSDEQKRCSQGLAGSSSGNQAVEGANEEAARLAIDARLAMQPEDFLRTVTGASELPGEGTEVEVLFDEPGLRGCWFEGRVLECEGSSVRVKYKDLTADAGNAGGRPLEEWVPMKRLSREQAVPSQKNPDKPVGSPPKDGSCRKPPTAALAPAREIRPCPPPELAALVSTLAPHKGKAESPATVQVGDRLDARISDGWWPGIVTAVSAAGITLFFPGDGDTQCVQRERLRWTLMLQDGSWFRLQGPPRSLGGDGGKEVPGPWKDGLQPGTQEAMEEANPSSGSKRAGSKGRKGKAARGQKEAGSQGDAGEAAVLQAVEQGGVGKKKGRKSKQDRPIDAREGEAGIGQEGQAGERCPGAEQGKEGKGEDKKTSLIGNPPKLDKKEGRRKSMKKGQEPQAVDWSVDPGQVAAEKHDDKAGTKKAKPVGARMSSEGTQSGPRGRGSQEAHRLMQAREASTEAAQTGKEREQPGDTEVPLHKEQEQTKQAGGAGEEGEDVEGPGPLVGGERKAGSRAKKEKSLKSQSARAATELDQHEGERTDGKEMQATRSSLEIHWTAGAEQVRSGGERAKGTAVASGAEMQRMAAEGVRGEGEKVQVGRSPQKGIPLGAHGKGEKAGNPPAKGDQSWTLARSADRSTHAEHPAGAQGATLQSAARDTVQEQRRKQLALVKTLYERFAQKREAIPLGKLPVYSQGKHLHGVDKAALEEALAELWEEEPKAAEDAQLSSKQLMQLVRAKIRSQIVNKPKTQQSFLPEDGTALEAAGRGAAEVGERGRAGLAEAAKSSPAPEADRGDTRVGECAAERMDSLAKDQVGKSEGAAFDTPASGKELGGRSAAMASECLEPHTKRQKKAAKRHMDSGTAAGDENARAAKRKKRSDSRGAELQRPTPDEPSALNTPEIERVRGSEDQQLLAPPGDTGWSMEPVVVAEEREGATPPMRLQQVVLSTAYSPPIRGREGPRLAHRAGPCLSPVTSMDPLVVASEAQLQKQGRQPKPGAAVRSTPSPAETRKSSPGIPQPGAKGLAHEKVLTAAEWAARRDLVASISLAWSPLCATSPCAEAGSFEEDPSSSGPHRPAEGGPGCCSKEAFLAVGSRSGHVSVWGLGLPEHTLRPGPQRPKLQLATLLKAHSAWVTAIAWDCVGTALAGDAVGTRQWLLLLTGSSDGSVRLWSRTPGPPAPADSKGPQAAWAMTLLREVCPPDGLPVTCVALHARQRGALVHAAAGKAGGQLVAAAVPLGTPHHEADGAMAPTLQAHSQAVTGLSWSPLVGCLYTCSQDNRLHSWRLHQGQLQQLPLPSVPPLQETFTASGSDSELMAASLDSYMGLALSPNGLALATVRGVAQDVLDRMYLRRTMKGSLQLAWVAGQQTAGEPEPELPGEAARVTRDATPPSDSEAEEGEAERWSLWQVHISKALRRVASGGCQMVLWDIVEACQLAQRAGAFDGLEVALSTCSMAMLWRPRSGDQLSGAAPQAPNSQLSGVLQDSTSACLQMLSALIRRLGLLPPSGSPWAPLRGPHSARTPDQESAAAGEAGSTSGRPGQAMLEAAVRILEHELRQRLVLASLLRAGRLGSGRAAGKPGTRRAGEASGLAPRPALLLADWVVLNAGAVGPALVEAALRVYQQAQERPPQSGVPAVRERCGLCGAPVALEGPDWGCCTGSAPGAARHRLPRCALTMQLCSGALLWRCTCCQRRASGNAPLASLTASSTRRELQERGTSGDPLCEERAPHCPFCGILLQPTVPSTSLVPALV